MYGARSAVTTGGVAATLPFTGLNVMWLILAGVTLITVSLSLSRLARR